MRLITAAIVLCLSVYSLSVYASPKGRAFDLTQDNGITEAIARLRADASQTRLIAKADLLTAGPAAIEPLMSLLSELLDNLGDTNEEDVWRLIYDCCELLGKLRANRAVRLLIKVIEVDEVPLMLPRRLPEIVALEVIGKGAEDALIEELKTGFQKAALLVGQRLSDGDARKLQLQERKAERIQIQVGATLGSIGDNSTIEALESLHKSEAYLGRSARAIIEHTISTIKSKINR